MTDEQNNIHKIIDIEVKIKKEKTRLAEERENLLNSNCLFDKNFDMFFNDDLRIIVKDGLNGDPINPLIRIPDEIAKNFAEINKQTTDLKNKLDSSAKKIQKLLSDRTAIFQSRKEAFEDLADNLFTKLEDIHTYIIVEDTRLFIRFANAHIIVDTYRLTEPLQNVLQKIRLDVEKKRDRKRVQELEQEVESLKSKWGSEQ